VLRSLKVLLSKIIIAPRPWIDCHVIRDNDHHDRWTTTSISESSASLVSLSGMRWRTSRALSAWACANRRVRSTPEVLWIYLTAYSWVSVSMLDPRVGGGLTRLVSPGCENLRWIKGSKLEHSSDAYSAGAVANPGCRCFISSASSTS